MTPDDTRSSGPAPQEPRAVVERYARRGEHVDGRYDPLSPSVYLGLQERHRALVRLILGAGLVPVADKRVLEIGCGSGSNLLELIGLGFSPANLVGNELLPERARIARERLPAAVRVVEGDASSLDFDEASLDVVYQSTVFTSLLDARFQEHLARRMWHWVRPGGGILWYDFVYDNPRNPDVRGIPVRRIRELFPEGALRARRVTLAPPISRRIAHLHPSLYPLLNLLPLLRTHVLCWIGKNRTSS